MIAVVPLAGTWIETLLYNTPVGFTPVVPLAGTWIETQDLPMEFRMYTSFPLRERGLKHGQALHG